ncbi:MAG: hypothetical protein P9L99_16030 [Candidatus Lernaella stagnicola]|nr:hypothetical protein [Candidatus Lernaella stagnicola]
MRRISTVMFGGALIALLVLSTLAVAGMKGKLYVKTTEMLLTERSGNVCRAETDNYCERNYNCPIGTVAHAVIYNIKEDDGEKMLAGLSLVCSDPNAFSNPTFVGAGGDKFAGEVINDYCPVGYMLSGSDFYTSDRIHLTGVRRVCRRYQPFDERRGPNLYGKGFDSMANVCPEGHWVTGAKVSFERVVPENGAVDSSLINVRYYCSEVRHFVIEPSKKELEEAAKETRH